MFSVRQHNYFKMFIASPRPRWRGLLFIVFGLVSAFSNPARAVGLSDHPALLRVATELVDEGWYSMAQVESIIAGATVQEEVLSAMKSPAETKFTWGRYRNIFMQPERIAAGTAFWRQHESVLARAQSQFGVPAEVIVAIIAIESKFGEYKGRHRVLDALVSLVVDFPRRSDFFARELKAFLILCKENDLQADQVLGSYAGAMGYPQFISSSYRSYAVDFSGDERIDLIHSVDDAIGSIANYFVENGWRAGQPVTSDAHLTVPEAVRELASRQRKVQHEADVLRNLGAPLGAKIPSDESLGVLMLDASEQISEQADKGVYIVKAGDTACQIALEHSVSCRTLMRINELDAKGRIYRGQRLTLPHSKASSATQGGEQENGKWQINARRAVANGGVQARYFFTHENFYVITRYNQSVLYAMAVHELSTAIRAHYEGNDVNGLEAVR